MFENDKILAGSTVMLIELSVFSWNMSSY